jgi:hypothetical protein
VREKTKVIFRRSASLYNLADEVHR